MTVIFPGPFGDYWDDGREREPQPHTPPRIFS